MIFFFKDDDNENFYVFISKLNKIYYIDMECILIPMISQWSPKLWGKFIELYKEDLQVPYYL